MTTPRDSLRARQAVGRAFGQRLSALRGSRISTHSSFTYQELFGWKQRLGAALGGRGITILSANVTDNRVHVGSPGAAVDELVREAARQANIPARAVRVVRFGQVSDAGLLTDPFRPAVPGGAGITSTYWTCTLGVNARRGSSGPWQALTASHCSSTRGGGADATYFYQRQFRDDFIGKEVDDPEWRTVGCSAGFASCRYADVAAIDYEAVGVVADSAWLAVTDMRDSPSLTWRSKSLDSRRINADFGPDQPFEGSIIDRVGATSGWWHGTVRESCTPVAVPTLTNASYECQTVVSGGVTSDGDSGGPAFGPGPGAGVMFAGIVWGKTAENDGFILSSPANLRADLGDLAFTF